jgi:hypothetical protein
MTPEEVTSGSRVGRPKLVTLEKIQTIATLRSTGLTWPTIGQRLGLKPETCRRAYWIVRKARGAVGFPPAGPAGEVPGARQRRVSHASPPNARPEIAHPLENFADVE